MPLCQSTIRIAILASAFGFIAACGQAAGEIMRPRPEPSSALTIDINSATRDQLAALPGIGPATAQKIAEHRIKFGPFLRKEHLMLVNGVSEKKYRMISPLVAAR